MSSQVFASDGKIEQNSADAEVALTEAVVDTRAVVTPFTVASSKVYPAHTASNGYYDIYTELSGGGQSCNGTLSQACAAVYRQQNCDGFYVQASINAGSAKTYKLYSNGTLVRQGSVPSEYVTLSVMVKNNNPGNWKLVLYQSGDTVGIPVWGNIYLD